MNRQTQTTVSGRQVQGDDVPGAFVFFPGVIVSAPSVPQTVTITVDPFADADEPTVVEGGRGPA